MKPGETVANKKRVYFMLFSLADGEPITAGYAPIAGELQYNRDEAGWTNATLANFTHIWGGLHRYVFDNAEIAGATEGVMLLRLNAATVRPQVCVISLELIAVDSLAAGSVTAAVIADGAIDAAALAADTITAAKIAADAITAAKIAAGAITSAKFAAGAIDAAALAADAITAAKIATDAIDADALKTDAVTEIQGTVPGLLMRRAFTDQTVYSVKKVLTSARVRVFADEATLATAAGTDADNAHGEINRWRWSAVDPGTGLATSWKLVQEL